MGLKSSLKIAKRSLTRRKTKNLSAILAIALGVTLMVGIEITTATLESNFLTSLLMTEGEVDFRISGVGGTKLSSADKDNITALVPNALAIMPELKTKGPAMIGSQFEPAAEMAGIPLNYSKNFGSFYEWESGEIMDISKLLVDNTSVLLSSRLAKKLGLEKTSELPITIQTEFNNITFFPLINETTGFPVINTTTMQPIFIPVPMIQRENLTVVGMYDSNRPGIGAQYRSIVFSLEGLQDWMSLFEFDGNKDLITSYLVTYQTDHFKSEIDEDFLKTELEDLEEAIPEIVVNGVPTKAYSINSARLLYMQIIGFIFTIMSSFLNLLGFLIIVTGILLITNVQLMSVEDREFQTGVLRAVGEKRRGIFQSMLFETLFQGIIGGLIGLLGGLIFGYVVAIYLASLFGTGAFSVEPVINTDVVLLSVIIGVVLGILTGLLPALRASRVNIVEALRGIRIAFEQKSSRNFVIIGLLMCLLGIYFLLVNGIIDTELDYIWEVAGWDSDNEWVNILLGAGFLFSGLGIVLSRYIDRTKAFNLTAIVLWATPVFMFIVAMGEGWITDMGGRSLDILIVAVVEIIIGSVMIVGMNLSLLMRFLRATLIKIRGIKGVAQVAPALISSHRTRSILTFAIFAVVLTLNVTVASIVATNIDSSIGQSEEDSRGIDIVVKLSKPEIIVNDTSYIEELKKLDSDITDIIGIKTYTPSINPDEFIFTEDPINDTENRLPIGFGELRTNQIRGNATNASETDWRYDFYLNGFPDGVRKPGMSTAGGMNFAASDISDEELLDMSKKAWDVFFDPSYRMKVYNITFNVDMLSGGDMSSMMSLFSQNLDELEVLKDENGNNLTLPIVFTDSFILPLGMRIWVPMNKTGTPKDPIIVYQPFVIGGKLDSNRAGGFPLSSSFMASEGEFMGGSEDSLGSIYIPERYSNFTNFFGEAGIYSANWRKPEQFDSYLIKTKYAIDDPILSDLSIKIEEFTNTHNEGYRKIANDNFIVATSTSLYAKLERSLEMMEQMTSFLQIYVNFGLLIGAVGMAVISVRNVAERKREIGMMRAIGFPRLQVMLSALLELVVLGFIGLIIGVVNGLIINIGFANMMNVPVVIPWGTIGAYMSFITFIGLLAGAIPGWVASRIPAAEALRYVG